MFYNSVVIWLLCCWFVYWCLAICWFRFGCFVAGVVYVLFGVRLVVRFGLLLDCGGFCSCCLVCFCLLFVVSVCFV